MVVTGTMEFYDFPETVGNGMSVIIPTDFHSLTPSFFKGLGQTTNRIKSGSTLITSREPAPGAARAAIQSFRRCHAAVHCSHAVEPRFRSLSSVVSYIGGSPKFMVYHGTSMYKIGWFGSGGTPMTKRKPQKIVRDLQRHVRSNSDLNDPHSRAITLSCSIHNVCVSDFGCDELDMLESMGYVNGLE